MRKVAAPLLALVMALAGLPLAAHAVQRATAGTSPDLDRRLAAAAPTDRLVVLVHGTSRGAALAAVDGAGLDRIVVLESVGVVAASGTAAQIDRLARRDGVTYVEANAPLELYSDTAAVATRTAEARSPGSPVLGPNGPYTGAGHTIAFVDGGVDGTHPMFRRPDGTSKVVRNLKVACVPQILSAADTCPTGGASDGFLVDMRDTTNDSDTISAGGHGTHVASIAAGVPTAYGERTLSGTAPGADLVGISVGAGINILTADIALDWIARNHANPCEDRGETCNPITVVNNSYGPDGGGEFDPNSTTAKISSQLVASGIVVVWANGNGDATDTDDPGGDGSANRSNPEGQNPLPGIISVANYDDHDSGTRDGSLNPSSSRGDASRPSTWPDVSAPGTTITAACRPYLAVCSSREPDPNFGTISGTSMAAPHVAGIVALLQEAHPGITPAQIEAALEDTAHRFQSGAGYGTDPSNATTPSSFDKGHGLVDTVAALQAVVSGAVTSSVGPCTGLTGTDATNEPQPYAVTATTAPYDPKVDLTGASLTSDPGAGTLTLRLGVADVSPMPTTGGIGVYAEARFIVGTATHTIVAMHAPDGTTGEGDGTSDGVTTTFDGAANTITVTVPRATFEPDLGGAFHVGGVNVQLGRLIGAANVGGAVAWADDASTGCGDLEVGGSAPVPPPPPPPPTGGTWFVHYTGPCDGSDADHPYLDTTDSVGDNDGCGSAGVLNSQAWTSTVPVGAPIPKGTRFSGTVYIETYDPGAPVMDVVLSSAAGDIAAASTDPTPTLGIGDDLTGTWTPMTFDVVTDRDVAAGELFTFTATFTAPVTVFIGYEGDHTSQFALGAAA